MGIFLISVLVGPPQPTFSSGRDAEEIARRLNNHDTVMAILLDRVSALESKTGVKVPERLQLKYVAPDK